MNRLFRHTVILILTGLFLTGCVYEDTVRDVSDYRADGEGLAIAFNDGFVDNPIRTKAVDLPLLSRHMKSMGVWGWQTTPAEAVECLFLNKEVTFNSSLGRWTYSPVKYWDNSSTYRFCAYAPHSSSAQGVTAEIDATTMRVSLTGVTLNGSNTIGTATGKAPANFADVEDIDWMLDRNVQSMAGIYHNEVSFNMQHILSKLCVRVLRSDAFLSESEMSITIDSITIGKFIRQGNFSASGSTDPATLATEWTLVDTLPRYTMCSAKNVSIPDTAVYVMESLLIPQAAQEDHIIQIRYKIGNPGGFINEFNATFRLDEKFDLFLPGRNYIITLLINPETITFDGGQSGWEDQSIYRKFIN